MSKRNSIAIGILVFLSGCGYYHEVSPTSGGAAQQPLNENQTLGYEVVKTILARNRCLECHSSAGGDRAGVNLETYESVKSRAGALVSVTRSGFMPMGGPALAAADVAVLEAWNLAGAPEFSEIPIGSAPEPVRVTFTDIKARILEPFCLRCHGQFGDYARVAGRLGEIQSAINSGRMPKNAPPLSAPLKTLLADWIAAGAPEQ